MSPMSPTDRSAHHHCYHGYWLPGSPEWSDQSLNINLPPPPSKCLHPVHHSNTPTTKKWCHFRLPVNIRFDFGPNVRIQFRHAGCHSWQIARLAEPNDSLLQLFALITELCPWLSDRSPTHSDSTAQPYIFDAILLWLCRFLFLMSDGGKYICTHLILNLQLSQHRSWHHFILLTFSWMQFFCDNSDFGWKYGSQAVRNTLVLITELYLQLSDSFWQLTLVYNFDCHVDAT